jgi:DNA-binding beta-propeller fold protein YncE
MDSIQSRDRLRITKLTIEEEFISEFATGHFSWPAGLALDSQGNLYCSDERDNLIHVYSPDGEKLDAWGRKGAGQGQFSGPCGLAFDGADTLHVVDTFNHRVQRFTRDGASLGSWGSAGVDPGQFDRPWGVTIDENGDVYVADWGNNRVQKFAPDGSFLMSIGSVSYGGELNHPADVAVDSQGDVYVTDWGNKRVQIYDAAGEVLTALYGDAMEFSQWGRLKMEGNEEVAKAYARVEDLSPLGKFDRPRGIAIDERDRVVVVDSTRCRLQVYAKEDGYTDPELNL